MKTHIYLIFLLITLFSARNAFANTITCDFECTYKKHIRAIEQKDYPAFESTLTKGDKLTFILPNGKYFDDAQEYRTLLKGWFNETGWTFNSKVITTDQTNEIGSVLLKVDYHEPERNGQPYHLRHFLYLVFKKQQGQWLLVHDQNTKIE